MSQNVDVVAALMNAGAKPNFMNRKGITPISAAAHKGNTDVMQILIDGGADVNMLNSSGSTALIQASHFGHVDAVNLLLKNKATADFANQKGTTALMRASQEGHVEISRLLIDAGVDVNRKNNEGMNALMLASQRGHSEMALLLIRARAAVDEQTSQGSTALMLACKRGHEKVVEVLVSMGSELYIRDSRNRCARDTAEKRHWVRLLKYLDTQTQIKTIQSFHVKQRQYLFSQLRRAHHFNRLRVDDRVLRAIMILYDRIFQTNPEMPLGQLEDGVKYTQTESNNSIHLLGRAPYQDWQWPLLLLKCFEMPLGVFDLIMDFLPSPRIWEWSLQQLKRRCRLAPRVAVLDLYIIIDEILADLNIFQGRDQRCLLEQLMLSREKQDYLVNSLGMRRELVDQLCRWHDLQSVSYRTDESDVTYKSPVAKKVLNIARALYKWYTHHCSPVKTVADLLARSGTSLAMESGTNHAYSAEFTDTGGLDESETAMDHDQDTETENIADGENDIEHDEHDDVDLVSDEEPDADNHVFHNPLDGGPFHNI